MEHRAIYMCVVVAMTCVRGFECELFNVCVQLLSLDRPQKGETLIAEF